MAEFHRWLSEAEAIDGTTTTTKSLPSTALGERQGMQELKEMLSE